MWHVTGDRWLADRLRTKIWCVQVLTPLILSCMLMFLTQTPPPSPKKHYEPTCSYSPTNYWHCVLNSGGYTGSVTCMNQIPRMKGYWRLNFLCTIQYHIILWDRHIPEDWYSDSSLNCIYWCHVLMVLGKPSTKITIESVIMIITNRGAVPIKAH